MWNTAGGSGCPIRGGADAGQMTLLHLVALMPTTSRLAGYLCIALAAALWGSLGVVSRVLPREVPNNGESDWP